MATYYLNADTGANGNPGTSGSPWETFIYAESQMSNGDTVIAQDSTATYAFATTTINVSITLQGESVGGAVFDGAGGDPIWTIQESFTIDKIVFQNISKTTGQRTILYLVSAASDSVVAVTACMFRDISGSSVSDGIIGSIRGGTALTMRFTGCLFYNIAVTVASGSLFVTVAGADVDSTIEVQNCTFYFDATDVGGASRFVFRDPYAIGNTMTATNCIFQNDAAFTMSINIGFTFVYNNNCTYGDWAAAPAGNNNITVDPLFVDTGNDNFNLRPTSPCIDTGTLI